MGGTATCAFLVVQACTNESVSGVDIGSVSVSPAESSVMERLSVQFDAAVYDDAGVALPTAAVTWSSDEESVATVDAAGVATGVAVGETLIRATFDGSQAAALLTVLPGPGIAVTPSAATIYGAAGGPPPGPMTLRLTPEGGGSVSSLAAAVSYQVGSPGGWLSAALSAASLPSDLTLSAAPAGLPVGRHRATVEVTWTSAEAGDGAASIPVILSLTAFTVTESDGATRVSEPGTSDSLSIALDAAPTSDVTLLVTVDVPGEATVSPATLTFTPADWSTAHVVTVTGVDDAEVDGDRTTKVTVSVDDSRSDVSYRPAVDRAVSVTTVDDDEAGVLVTETAGATVVTETGGTDSITVVLRTQPPSNVVITATASDGGEANVAPTTVTFRPVDWDVPRVVVVTGVDDPVVDGSQTSTVVFRVDDDLSDPSYRGIPDAVVSVTTSDDDPAGLSISESQGSTAVTEAGAIDAFTVVLTAQPSADVVVAVTSDDTGEVIVSPSTLTFTSADWSTAQPVAVTGVDDDVLDGAVVADVRVAVDASRSAPEYGGIPVRTVAVTTADDDVAGFSLADTAALAVTEAGGRDVFTVVLGASPTASVLLEVTSADLGEVTASPSTLTFTSANWSAPQSVTLTGVDDPVDDGDQRTAIALSVLGAQSDPSFAGLSASTEVTTANDDAAGVTVSETALTVLEVGGAALFTVRLDSEPTASVTLDISSLDQGEVAVLPTSVTFTPGDWSVPQEVAVLGVADLVADGDQATLVSIVVDPARSDPVYAGVPVQQVLVTTTDVDVGVPLASGR